MQDYTTSGSGFLAPGALVLHPGQPEWGIGQVQSAVGNRITVNFEHAGKKLINSDVVDLVPAEQDNRSENSTGR